ncbi:MAG: hypothetical protein ACRD2A_03830 [Vicinamibacterales bacterium]
MGLLLQAASQPAALSESEQVPEQEPRLPELEMMAEAPKQSPAVEGQAAASRVQGPAQLDEPAVLAAMKRSVAGSAKPSPGVWLLPLQASPAPRLVRLSPPPLSQKSPVTPRVRPGPARASQELASARPQPVVRLQVGQRFAQAAQQWRLFR